MILRLDRLWLKENYTVGNLYVNGAFFCNTLEDKVRDLSIEPKIAGKTAIPYGVYRVVMSFSQRFSRMMPEILNVPHFTAIRLHSGNSAENTEGCPLLGKNDIVGGLTRSRFYSNALNQLLSDTREPISLVINKI